MVTDLEPNKGTRNILEFDSANFIFTPICFCWCSWSLNFGIFSNYFMARKWFTVYRLVMPMK